MPEETNTDPTEQTTEPAPDSQSEEAPKFRFTAKKKGCPDVLTDDPRYAQNLQALGYSVIDGLSGKEYTGKRPA